MAIHKVIEVISQSEKSWEDAAQHAVAEAGRTVQNIKSIWIKNFELKSIGVPATTTSHRSGHRVLSGGR